MRSRLELRSLSNGTGWSETWSFSGAQDRRLRDALRALDEHATEPPPQVYDRKAGRHVIQGDRWRAAMLLWPDEPATRHAFSFVPHQADAAWTVAGALALAELLPEELDDLRTAILARFASAS